eukprot:m.42137 g.42137  ORF g.42137 m.42137 type:complete len:139 (-) comp15012_c0_seq1:122-538(-)
MPLADSEGSPPAAPHFSRHLDSVDNGHFARFNSWTAARHALDPSIHRPGENGSSSVPVRPQVAFVDARKHASTASHRALDHHATPNYSYGPFTPRFWRNNRVSVESKGRERYTSPRKCTLTTYRLLTCALVSVRMHTG